MNNRNAHHRILWCLQYTGANWMSCVGCVGANYTKFAQNQQLKNDTRACISVLRLVRSCCQDCYQIHPPMFCNKCYLTMKHVTTAAIHKKPYKCGLKPYDWYNHTIPTAVRYSIVQREIPLHNKDAVPSF